MTAKEYLSQTKELRSTIEIKEAERKRYKNSQLYFNAATKELEPYKEELIRLEKEITECILNVRDAKYRKILYWLYIEGKKMGPLAKEMQYEYHYLCSLHTKAIKEFERVNKDKLEGLEGE